MEVKIMEAIRLHKIVEKDGEISATGLPCKKGQRIEMILLIEPSAIAEAPYPTARQLLDSGLIGLWEDRKDIEDSWSCARQLRE
jgi:hypothetical protein